MRYAIRLMLFALPVIILAGSSCARYRTSSSRTIDTIYVKKLDTVVVQGDTMAIERVRTEIETVFMEVEKDCPSLQAVKVLQYKTRVKEVCSMESLSGGELKAHSPDLRSRVTFVFKGNDPTAIWEVDQVQITDKTEETIVKEISFFRKVLDTWPFWAFPWAFFLLWVIVRSLKR